MKQVNDPIQLILKAVKGLEKGQKQLQKDFKLQRKEVSGIRTDVSGLRTDVNLQQKEISGIRTELGDIHTELRQQGTRQEAMDDKLNLIVEAVAPQFEKHEDLKARVEEHGNTLAVHDLRLQKLES